MAEMQKEDYKFPDEMEETNGKPEDELEEGFEVVEVDDTPKEDRNVEPLPNDIKKDLETAKMKAETEAKMALMQDQMATILAAVGEKKPRKSKAVATEEV
jgi:hypothetical protein